MRFSQRIGITPLKKAIQVDSIDDELRNTLWSATYMVFWNKFNRSKWDLTNRNDFIRQSNLYNLFAKLWLDFFKMPIDTIPRLYYDSGGGLSFLRDFFFNAKWFEVYDFIEFLVDNGEGNQGTSLIDKCNPIFERENSGYRFVDGKIIEISSADEIAEIEKAIEQSTPYYGVKQHLGQAISLLSDKINPDYRNSVKESISAVEALCKTVSGEKKATLAEGLKVLEKKGVMHPALKSAFSALYGYTNDAEGIRHALMAESKLKSADARFMLIACSAFINYVIAVTS